MTAIQASMSEFAPPPGAEAQEILLSPSFREEFAFLAHHSMFAWRTVLDI
jgi:hypothetical protein